jgi:hypothetical protein
LERIFATKPLQSAKSMDFKLHKINQGLALSFRKEIIIRIISLQINFADRLDVLAHPLKVSIITKN